MKISNKAYDFWKYVCMIGLPALAALVIAVFRIWNIPYGSEIGATIMAFDAFLGALLKVSTDNYNKQLNK